MLDSCKIRILILLEYRKRGTKHLLLLNKLSEESEMCYDLPLIEINDYENVFTRIRTEIVKLTTLKIPVLEGENEMKEYQVRGNRVITYRSFCSVRSIDSASEKPHHIEVLRCKAEGSLNYIDNNQDLFLMVSLDEVAFMIEDSPERFNPFIVGAIKKYLKSTGYLVKSSN